MDTERAALERTIRSAGFRKKTRAYDRRINDCRIVAFCSAKDRDFRGAKGDSNFCAGPYVLHVLAALIGLLVGE